MTDEDLDKMADDMFNDITRKKPEIPRRPDNYADRFEGLIDDIRMAGGNVSDNWREMIEGFADEFDNMLAADLDESDLYSFEYFYMPELAETDWIDASSRDVCLGERDQVLSNAFERDIVFDPAGFKVERRHHQGLDIYVYEFPKPSRSPMALYGAIIFGDKGGRYYTLEFERPGCYMLCNPTTDNHYNFGMAKNSSKEGFVKKAVSLYKSAPTDI